MSKPITVYDKLISIPHSGDLNEIIELLTEFRDSDHAKQYTGLRLSQYQDDYSEEYTTYIVGDRPENEAEKKLRLEREAEQEKWQLQQYKELKKKFGDK
jgi:hypothetical protein